MLPKTKSAWFFTILAMLLLIAAQCSAQPAEEADRRNTDTVIENLTPVPLGAGERLRVVATTNIVADIAGNVGGDLIDLTTLLPVGSDPHTFAPAPRDVAAVAEAHVVFINGLGLEEFLEGLIKNAGGEAAVVPVSRGVETRELGVGKVGDAGEEESAQAAEQARNRHDHEDADPHVWTNPVNAILFVHNIARALSALDPANAEIYQTRAGAYETELAELDAWVKSQIETIPAENRRLITDHDSFGYYSDHYGLELVGAVVPAYSTNAEPSAQELAELQDAIGQYGVKAIFVGGPASPALAQRVADDTGIQLVSLYTGSLGLAGSGAETYLDYIRYNTIAIVKALR